MARAHRAVAAAAAAGAALLVARAGVAATLPVLRVDALAMRADRTHVAIGDVFHVAVHVHVRERVESLDDLRIPDIGTLQLLGDERTATHGAGGTDVVETLTLESAQSGTFTLAPAYIDAVDARDHRPKRFSAQHPVVITVGAPARVPTASAPRFEGLRAALAAVWGVLWRTVLALALFVIGIVAAARVLRRPRPVIPNAVEGPPAVVAANVGPPPSQADRVANALRAYRTTPGGAALERLREELFIAAGVDAGATLRDALLAAPRGPLHDALIAADDAAFGPAHVRDAASSRLIAATEAWLIR